MKIVLFYICILFFFIITPAFAEITISNDGENCRKIGMWDSVTNTCSLNTDLHEIVTIQSNNVILDGNNHKIVGNYSHSQSDNRSCISVDAKMGITIKNFELINCGYGVSFQDVINSKIINNAIHDNHISGIVMLQSSNNLIKNNEIFNQTGIGLNGNENIIESNLIFMNNKKLEGYGVSINIKDSSDNVVINNSISGYKWGLNFDGVFGKNTITNNTISDNQMGINLNTSEQFSIINNIVQSNEIGIRSHAYEGGGNHIIEKNTIISNKEGIHLESGNNVVTENTISKNTETGLWFEPRTQHTFDYNNKIYNNNFIDNSRQVFHGETNIFTVNNFGNYWSDFSPNCIDTNSDKICDDSYPFSSGTVAVVDTAVWKEKDGWVGNNSDDPKSIETASSTPEPEPEPKPVDTKHIPKSLEIPAPFVDETKHPQYYVDRYLNEPEYKEWFDENYPEYDSIYQAVGLSEPIPKWIRGVFTFWADGQISDDELKNAIKFLVDEGIIQLD